MILSTLKTMRDASLSAAFTLSLFGLPVGVASIPNVFETTTIEDIATPVERRVVTLPAPPEAPAAPATEDEEPIGADAAPSGGSGPAVPGVARRGLRVSEIRGRTMRPTRSRSTGHGTVTKPGTRRTNRCAPDNPQIVVEAEGSRVVERSLLDHYAGSIKELNKLGYVKRHVSEDARKSDGLLVRGIRCGNDLHELGIRNQDVVHSVNGKSVRNLAQAIAVYFQLRNREHIEVDLTRGGKRMTLRYRLA